MISYSPSANPPLASLSISNSVKARTHSPNGVELHTYHYGGSATVDRATAQALRSDLDNTYIAAMGEPVQGAFFCPTIKNRILITFWSQYVRPPSKTAPPPPLNRVRGHCKVKPYPRTFRPRCSLVALLLFPNLLCGTSNDVV